MPIYALDNDHPEIVDPWRYWIAPGAQVIGKVRLGIDVGIWFGAVLRGDNELIDIEERTNLQDGVLVHTDKCVPLKIGAGCTVGHSAILHGCEIGRNTLIGMGATVLNHARIGANSIVGARALVTEGKVFPDNSLIVGMPARVVGAVDPETAKKLAETAERYVQNARRFRQGLHEVVKEYISI
ncbi:gamma carbonic anhydrase family protein [Bradyrhizobium diazoefficiens]|nr:gamma carbonic anhydrase family protein [Bradyrhizobium diazoefficiens]QQN62300.1 gamma carbonic anhydrase family protein [Bradyrhizobium diazoefficiens]